MVSQVFRLTVFPYVFFAFWNVAGKYQEISAAIFRLLFSRATVAPLSRIPQVNFRQLKWPFVHEARSGSTTMRSERRGARSFLFVLVFYYLFSSSMRDVLWTRPTNERPRAHYAKSERLPGWFKERGSAGEHAAAATVVVIPVQGK
jgi:hypothetical protein